MEDYGVFNSRERVVGVKKAGKGLCGSQDGGPPLVAMIGELDIQFDGDIMEIK